METLLNDLREYWPVDEQKVEDLIPTDSNLTRDSLPLVMAESDPLTLLLQNLLSHAIKYRRPDIPSRIHVSSRREHGHWIFSIADNGIEPKHLEDIFAPFKRLYGKEYPGSGLGLAMCQKIVSRCRGRIWVESKRGRGSRFSSTLPVMDGAL